MSEFRPKQRLMSRLMGSFLTLSILTVAFVALSAFFQARSALRDMLFDRLRAVTTEMEDELSRWIVRQRDLIVLLAQLPELRRDAARLEDAPRDDDARERVEALLHSAGQAPGGFAVLSLLSTPAGQVLASTDPDRRGVYHVNDYFYTRGKEETFVQNVYTSPLTARPTLTVSTPIRDDSGRTVAVLAGDLDLAILDRLTAGRRGLGETGEVYLVSESNDFVSSARFGREEFRRGVFSEGIDAALGGESGVGVYENYAGVPVIGAFRWSPELELALIVEMKQAEAFAPARRLVKTILGIGIVSALLLAGGVYVLARQIARPVVALTEAAAAVARGDFETRAPVLSRDEVGVLARAFNAMTTRLRELYDDLNEQVEARTSALVALEKSEQLLRSIVDNSTTLIAVIDAEEKLLLVNASLASLLGLSAKAPVGRRVVEVLPPELARLVLDTARRARADGKTAGQEAEVELGGDRRSYLLVCFSLERAGAAGVGLVATDITESKRAAVARQRLEAQVLHAQKLESLGLMAGGIAHDFNNILTVISGNAELALHGITGDERTRARLEKLLRATRQAAELTGQMLAYAGKARFDQEELELSAVVQDVLPLLEASCSKKVAIRCALSDRQTTVHASRAQLTQLVLNLATNAAEAVGEDVGMVTVGTRGPEETGRPMVQLSVADTGSGMDAATRDRIFDPFFSTKGTGRGIGLAAVLGIARSAGAEISVESTPGAGSTFTVEFPYVREGARVEPSEARDEETAEHGGTVLVADDEPLVRDVARELLERFGYTVLEAADGVEAVALYQTHARSIDAVLLDLTMPGMSGAEALRAMRKIDPRVRAILTSGYDAQGAAESLDGTTSGDVLQKPYRAETLLARLQSVLRGVGTRS